MIKASVFLLVLALLAVSQVLSQSRNLPLMGGHTAFDDFSSPGFLRVLNAIYEADPRVNGWTPYNATSQIVAGKIYNFYLKSPQDSSTAYVSGIDDFIQGTARILKYIPPETSVAPNPSVASSTSNSPQSQSPNPSTPSYSPFTDYTNQSFRKALAQAKNQDYLLFSNYQLIGTELYVSSRFYYFKFTFPPRNNPGSLPFQLNQVVAFENPVIQPYNGVGRIQSLSLSKPELFFSAYEQIVKVYPRFALYDIACVKKQIVVGVNYYFVMERRYDAYEKVSVNVYVDQLNRYQVSANQDDLSFGYSQEVIDQTKLIAVKTWPELQNYIYFQTSNIKNDKSGLRITYRSMISNGDVKYVDLEIVDGKETLSLDSY